MRLKAIAVERAPTIAMQIQRICRRAGKPFAASTAPRNANGNAKSVCSILIISSVMPTFFRSGGAAGFNDELLFHTGEIFSGFGGSLPARSLGMRYTKVVKNSKYEMVDESFYRPWPVIETRARRDDVRAGPS